MVEQSQTRQGAFVLERRGVRESSFRDDQCRSLSPDGLRFVLLVGVTRVCVLNQTRVVDSLGPPAPGPWLFSAVQIWQPKG
jgi:hypothetical protein